MSRSYVKVHALTERECDVLRLMAEGKSHAEIGKEWCISPATVRTHANAIYSKLHVTSRTDAVIKAHAWGIVRLPGLSPVALAILQLLRVEPGAWQELIESGVLEREP